MEACKMKSDIKKYLSKIGTKGGSSRSERKTIASRVNAIKAREAKANKAVPAPIAQAMAVPGGNEL